MLVVLVGKMLLETTEMTVEGSVKDLEIVETGETGETGETEETGETGETGETEIVVAEKVAKIVVGVMIEVATIVIVTETGLLRSNFCWNCFSASVVCLLFVGFRVCFECSP